MSELETITADARERTGTGGARAARRAGKLPGILYGGGNDPVPLNLDPLPITKAYRQGNFMSTLVTVKLNGEAVMALPREVQTDPVRDHIIHVDFMRVDERTRITVDVPIRFINGEDSPGLSRGGVLNVVRHEVALSCPATAIPPSLEADLTGLDIGDAIKISAIELPEGVRPIITDRDFTVATVAAPSVLKTPEEEAEEAATAAELEEDAEAIEGEEGVTPSEDGEAAPERAGRKE